MSRCFPSIIADRPEALLTAMAALLICLGGARTAHATCGDYLVMDPDAAHDGSEMDASLHRFLINGFPSVPARAPVPCDGPSCGEAPDNGVTDAIPIEFNRRSPNGFALLQGNGLHRPLVVERLEIESETATSFSPRRLLRPPRTAS